MSLFYKPDDGWAADFIPFFWDGRYHLFYLKDYRNREKHGEGTPWWHLVTDDFVSFEDWGEALPRGSPDEQDLYVFTGCAIRAQGLFHIFYTGHNSYLKDKGGKTQGVMHATSDDLRRWTKHPEHTFYADPGRYELHDWRDPFVFFDDEAQEYRMLLAAREKAGPGRNRGCVALTASRDLVHWGTRQPFWSPSLYYTHECPDLFRVGDWHYLVYSEFSDRSMTRYRMSRSLKGPWIAPPNDSFDGRAYYAAKTAGDGQRRFVFGWLPTRGGDKDDGGWQWGGHLVVHQVVQRRDGTLAVRVPRTILDAFQRRLPLSPQPVLGTWTVQGDYFRADATDRFSALLLGELPCECLIEADISFSKPTAGCGLLFRSDAELNSYYQLRLEPHANRVVFDRWPRPGDQPFVIERPFVARPGNFVHFRVLLDGTCLVAYLDDEIALSCRMYDHPKGQLGVFVSESQARFDRVSIKARR